MKKITFLLITLFLSLQFQISNAIVLPYNEAETKLSSYTQLVLMEYREEMQKSKSAQPHISHAKSIVTKGSTTYLNAFVRFNAETAIEKLEQQGVIFETLLDGIATCLIPIDQLEDIKAIESVTGIEVSQPVYANLDSVRRCSNITAVQQGLAPLNKSYQGNGVIVGVVDEGFDFTHPNYYDKSGTNYRVKKAWVQKATSGTPPANYTSGAEYTTPATIQAVQTDNVQKTHGTHTSGIAAGSGYGTNFTGIAPASDIILVATDMSTTGIVNGVQYIADQAKGAAKPCVINLSLGSQVGPHDGTSLADAALNQISAPGTIIVGAAGNSGESPIHIQKQFVANTKDSIITVLSPAAPSINVMYSDIWARNNTPFSVQVLVYNTEQNAYTSRTSVYPVNSQSAQMMLYTASSAYQITFINQLYSGNGCFNSLVQIIGQDGFNSTEQIVIKVINNQESVVNLWATNGLFSNSGYANFTAGDTNYTVGEVGGVGEEVISVGAYATKLRWHPLSYTNPGMDQIYEGSPTLYTIAPFSSKGPTADNRIKPDISAPGFGVVSGFNSYNASYGYSNLQTVASFKFKNRTYYWGIDQGTSMACPVVAGTIALWLEANPTLTSAQIKDIFSEHAFDPATTRSLTKNNIYGWGKLDALSGMQEAIALNLSPVSEPDPVLSVYPNPSTGSFRISTKEPIHKIEISDLSGRHILEQQFSDSRREYEVKLHQATPGIYLISVLAENKTITSKVVIY